MSYKDNPKARAQRWALINRAIDLGIWEDEKHFRRWLYAEFGTSKTSKLSEQMTRVLYIYLKYYNGYMGEPQFPAPLPWRINNRQLWLMKEHMKALRWEDQDLLNFIERQLGVKTFPRALSKTAANKVLTGLEKVASWKHSKQTK